jgi:uncharacterized membrane protein YcaP (DUF421 family)
MWGDIMTNMFSPEISVLEKIVRPVLVYLFLLVGLRLAGKRELAQLNSMDLVVLLTISNTVQNAIIGQDNSLSGGLIGATTLLAVNHFVVRFLYGHEKIDRLVEGEPVILIERGKVLDECLEKELVTRTELETAAHKQGFKSLDLVERAVLEPGGTITFVGKQPAPGELRHSELTTRLDHISRDLAQLRNMLASRS